MENKNNKPNKKGMSPKASTSKSSISINDIATQVMKENRALDLNGIIQQEISPATISNINNKQNIKAQAKGTIRKSATRNAPGSEKEPKTFWEHLKEEFLERIGIDARILKKMKGVKSSAEADLTNKNQKISENIKKTDDDAITSDAINDKLETLYEIGTNVEHKVEDVSEEIEKLSDKVNQIYDRISVKDITVGKGKDAQTYRYDPLSPQGKQVKEISTSGKAAGFASKSVANRVLTAASYLGSKQIQKEQEGSNEEPAPQMAENKIVAKTRSERIPKVDIQKIDNILKIVQRIDKKMGSKKAAEGEERKSKKKEKEYKTFKEHFVDAFFEKLGVSGSTTDILKQEKEKKENDKLRKQQKELITETTPANAEIEEPQQSNVSETEKKEPQKQQAVENELKEVINNTTQVSYKIDSVLSYVQKLSGEQKATSEKIKTSPQETPENSVAAAESAETPKESTESQQTSSPSESKDDGGKEESGGGSILAKLASKIPGVGAVSSLLVGSGDDSDDSKEPDTTYHYKNSSEGAGVVDIKPKGVVSRREGSHKATGDDIEDFGSGTPAVLHGREGVVTEKRLNEIKQENKEQSQDSDNLTPNDSGDDGDDDIMHKLDSIQGAVSAIANRPPPPSTQPAVAVTGDSPPIFLLTRNIESSLSTYTASIFDHPVIHPGLFKM